MDIFDLVEIIYLEWFISVRENAFPNFDKNNNLYSDANLHAS